MTKILITGGTGLVGQHLSKMLLNKGYEVAILSLCKKTPNTAFLSCCKQSLTKVSSLVSNTSKALSLTLSYQRLEKKAVYLPTLPSRTKSIDNKIPVFYWDINNNIIDKEAINSSNYIIHLAGVNIAGKRWTKNQKQGIVDSRVKSTELLFNNIDPNHNLKAFISASAIGHYGAITSNHIFTETDSSADDFLGETCRLWEDSANKFQNLDIRTVKIRTGLVLSKQGGALSKMIKAFKLGIGSALGSGKQYMPWIHIDDLCEIYIKAIEDSEMNGAYNAVAPEHINNIAFSEKIAKQLKKPFWALRIPEFLFKLLFGEMADILLKGSRVSCDKIKATGYNFKYPTLKSALNNLL
ncbi:MAG: TIGR01777 family protein [Bacteroidales bacterium]|nr:TIGR01777 family protein [Bacteroidales bacterium]